MRCEYILARAGRTVDGRILCLDRLDLSRFRKNPVVYVEHDYAGKAPVGRVVRIRKTPLALIGVIEFLDTYSGREAQRLVKAGQLDGASIGLCHIRWRGKIIESATIFEVSIVRKPANRGCLRVA